MGGEAEARGMRIQLSEERRKVILGHLTGLYQDEFDETLSGFRAERIVDFFIRTLGPSVYNQAVQDVRKYMQERLDDLDAEFYEAEDDRGQ